MQPATGRQIGFGIARAPRSGLPPATYHDLVFVPPASAEGKVSRSDNLTVNRSGHKRSGLAGPRTFPVMFGLPFGAGLLPYLHGVLRGWQPRNEIEAGVFEYFLESVGNESNVDTVWGVLGSRPPVKNYQTLGVRLHKATTELTGEGNPMLTTKFEGMGEHGSYWSPAELESGAAAAVDPAIRGLAADPDGGDVFLQVTRDVAGGGLQFQLEQTSGAPAFGGVTLDVVVDSAGSAQWQDTGLGINNERTLDRLEINFAAEAADLATYAIGAVYRFRAPGTWTPPAMSADPAYTALTASRWKAEVRLAGTADPFVTVPRTKATLTLEGALASKPVNASLYQSQYWDGPAAVTISQSEVLDAIRNTLTAWKGEELEIYYRFFGVPVGAASQELVEWHLPHCELTELAESDDQSVTESTLSLVATEPPGGGSPVNVRIVTDIDWQPPA